MTTTQAPISTLRIDRERDDYRRSVIRYSGWSEDYRERREGAAIVRRPKIAHESPTLPGGTPNPGYGKPYMVNLDTVRGHLNPDLDHVVYVGTLREARAMVEALEWVREARDGQATVQDLR